MSNNWFAFKQFTVLQEKSAMKVGTDGVLLGVCTPMGSYGRILDVGTGTGLVALMLAQRFDKAVVDAVEIDADAADEAAGNFSRSPWSNRLSVSSVDFVNFDTNYKYDLIVSNPPFFRNSLKNGCAKRSVARHDDSLPLSLLFMRAAQLIALDGKLVLILPFEVLDELIEIGVSMGFSAVEITKVRPRIDKPYKRVVVTFKRYCEEELHESKLVIESDVRHSYTHQFLELTADFYLDK